MANPFINLKKQQDEDNKQEQPKATTGNPFVDLPKQPAQQQVQQQPKAPVSPSAAPGVFGQQKQTQRSKRADEVLADVASGSLRNTPRPVTYKQSNTNPQMQEGVTVNPHRGINFATRNESTTTPSFYDRVSLAARGKTDAISDSIAKERENKRVETDPTVLNYRAAERRKREAENELNRLKDGVKLPDGTTVLKDGTVLKPGEQETKLAQAQKAVDISVQQSRNFFGNLTKEQQNVETNPLGVVLKAGTYKGLAQAGYTSSGIFDAVLGKHGIIGTLLESAGGMFGDGINNLLQKDLINSEYIRSGDWNPVTKMHTKNTATMQAVNQYATKQAAGNKVVQQAIDVDAGVVQMLPLFYLQAYAGATGAGAATPGAVGTTQGLQYVANLNTANTMLQQSNIMFRHAAAMMARDPASQFTFSQSFGNSYNEAKQDGADNPHAIVYALLNATINTAVEMGGGIETLPAEMQAAAAAGRSGLWQMADAVCDEVKEENVQGFFERGLKSVYDQVEIASMTNPDAMINPNVMLQEATMAAIGTIAQIPVQRGIGRVVGNIMMRGEVISSQQEQDVFQKLDMAAKADESNNNDNATMAALQSIFASKEESAAFERLYKTDVATALREFAANAETVAPETAQKPAEAPTMPQGAEIPESTAEAPTAAPVELNSQERATAEDMLLNPTETRTTLLPAEQAPSLAQGGQENAQAQGAQTEERAADDVGPYEGKPSTEQPAEAPAPAQPAAKKTTATEATRKLQEKYGDGLRTQETRGKIQSLARQARETDFSDPAQVRSLWESAKQQAREILNTTEDPSARTGGDTGGEIRNYLRGQKIRIDERLRNDRPSEYESLLELRRKTFGTLNFSNTEGMTLDEVYQELGTMFGEGLFPQDTMSHSEIVERILDAVANEKGRGYTYEQSLSGAEYERAAADLAMELMRAAEGVTGTTIPTPVRETQQSLTLEQEREAAIESELDADFEGELTREDAERIVDERYEAYGEYDLDKILNGLEDRYGEAGEEADDFDEYAYYAERYRTADAENADEAADAGGSEELPETVGQGTPERGLAAYEPAGVGEVRGPGSLAPDGEVSGETGPEPGEAGGINEPAAGPKPIPEGAKLSKYWEHTLRTVEEAANAPDEVKQPLWYMPVTEVQSLAKAASRLAEDKQGTIEDLVESEAWNGVQYDAATMVADQLYAEGLKTGDMSGYEAWRLVLKEHVGDTARGLQAVKKTTRHTGRTAVDSVIDQMADSGLPKPVKNEVITEAANFGKELDSIKEGDTESLKDLVKRLAERRRNWTIFRGNMDKLLNKQSETWMREAAYRQIDALGRDAANRGLKNIGAKIASYNVLSMLSGIPTVARNLVGNGIFNPIDMFAANGPGRAIDALLGLATGQRAVVGHRAPFWQTVPAWFKNAADAMGTSMLEIALDIDTNENRSTPFMPANSAFIADSNPVERLFQRWTQIMGYALTSTDRFSRGGIESGELANYEAYDAKRAEKGKRGTGLSAEEQADLSQKTAEYRLFQQQTKLSQGEKAVRRWLNNAVGFGGKVSADGTRTKDNTFGLGSVLMLFVEVPTNLALKTLEWGPGNLAAATKDLITLGKFVHANNISSDGNKVSTAALQQKVSMEAARGLTGTALLVLCTALARMGLIRNGDDEDDYDVAAVNNITGQKGTQFNISATERSLTGGSTEWKPGDIVIGLGGISPLDMWLNAGTRFAALEEAENPMDWIGSRGQAYLQAAYQSTLDIPMFQTMADFQDTLRNAEKMDFDTAAYLVGDLADNQMSKIVPQFVRQSVRANDPYYRDTSSDSWMQERVNNAMQYLPFARQNLPTAVDSFGNPKEQQKESERWINALLSPTPFSTYRSNDVIDMLTELKNESGKDSFYPDRKPPKAVEIPDASGNGKETLQLNTEQKRAYQQTYGSTYTELASGLMESDSWGRMSTDEKLKAMANVEAFAKDAAKRALSESLGREYSSDWDDEDALARENLGGFIGTKTALNSAIKNKDYKTVDALLGDIDKMDKATKEQLFADVNRLDDRVAAHKAGIDTVLWEAAYAQKKKLEEDKSTTAVQDVISMTQYLDGQKGLNQKQKDLLREQMGFYTTFRADAEKFDKLTETGLSADKAGKVWNAINALQPMEGHAGVTQNQRLKAISSMGNLSDAEKWAVLELYASESAYKKAMDAKAKGWTFDQWVQSYTKGK